MGTIDLRHLVQDQPDNIVFIGSDDRQEYTLPVVKTLATVLFMEREFEILKNKVDSGEIDKDDPVNFEEIYITGWIRAYYKHVNIEWVRRNIPFELHKVLAGYIHKVFLSESAKQQESPKPKRKATTKRRTKSKL